MIRTIARPARLSIVNLLSMMVLLMLSLLLADGQAALAEETPSIAKTPEGDSGSTLFDPKDYQGKVVYLDFWASWCAPCKQSFPWMKRMQEQYGERGLEIVAVDVDRDPKAASEFLAKHDVPFKILYDPKGTLAETYDIKAMPSSFLYDRSGHQRSAHVGFKRSAEAEIEEQIRSLLEEEVAESNQGVDE